MSFAMRVCGMKWVVNIRWSGRIALLVAAIICCHASTIAGNVFFRYQPVDVSVESTVEGTMIGMEGASTAPFCPLPETHSTFRIDAGRLDSISISRFNPVAIAMPCGPLVSSLTTTYAGDETHDPNFYLNLMMEVSGEHQQADRPTCDYMIGQQRLAMVTLKPLELDSTRNELLLYQTIEVEFHGDSLLSVSQVDSGYEMMAMGAGIGPGQQPGETSPAQPTSSPYYLVVTNRSLSAVFEPLIRWKRIKGMSADVALIEHILAGESGADDAARLRSFLIEAYSAGTRYVLLGGDENVLPIRYAYNQDAADYPGLDVLQICDLYFADVNGNWDADGDGIYGEKSEDDADILAELMVGRLLADDPDEVATYVSKLVRYEQQPGGGDYDYLSRSLYIAADQMRDYQSGTGQHQLLADAFPANFTHDLTSLVESPSGAAENPADPQVSSTLSKLGDGWGVISLLVHGIADGWVSRSNLYNQWPKNYIYTREGTAGSHGYLPLVKSNNEPGLVYSVGCSHGAFDMDSPPFESTYPCIAESFLLKDEGGAVAFVGYSRWGWVSTSWRLEKAFLDYLFNEDGSVAEALAYSKAEYPYFLDIAYGLNLYGDPELHIWTQSPEPLSVSGSDFTHSGPNDIEINVMSDGYPVADALVTVTRGAAIVAQSTTGGNGSVSLSVDYEGVASYKAYAYMKGHEAAITELTPSIALGVDDDQTLPEQFALDQNYPNPFNPTTQIHFTLPRSSPVRLEIFNILGQTVTTLLDRVLGAGPHEVTWDGVDAHGTAQTSGVYFARITAGDQSDIIKMTMLK